MRKLCTFSLSGVLLLLVMLSQCRSALSAEPVNDVRIVIDISGSMKKSDPQKLRAAATELLVGLLPKGSKAGIWTFGRYVNMLVKHGDVDERWVRNARAKIGKINSVGLYTNIGEAMAKAGFDIKEEKEGVKRSLILLTDGVVDISKDRAKNQRERDRILTELLPSFKKAGVQIHTIALSQQADHKLMERLAVETNGFTAVAESADDLIKIFLQAFDKAVAAEEVPLDNNRFSIDKSIEEFTALIFRKPGSRETKLGSPRGQTWSRNSLPKNIRWHHTAQYDLITVTKPEAGMWWLEADVDPSNRVTVVSDLKLQVNQLKNNYFPGEVPTIRASFAEDGKHVMETSFLDLMEVQLVVENDEGKRRSKEMKTHVDGVFSTSLKGLPPKGNYKVIVEVDGKTFSRTRKQTIAYKIPLDTVTNEPSEPKVMKASVAKVAKVNEPTEPTIMAEVTVFKQNNHNKFLIKIIPDEFVDTFGSSVVAREKLPNGRSVIRSAPLQDEGYWKLVIDDTSAVGEYRIDFTILGKTKRGRSFKAKPESLKIQNPMQEEKLVVQLWGSKPEEAELNGSSGIQEEEIFVEELKAEQKPVEPTPESSEELIPPPIDISKVVEPKSVMEEPKVEDDVSMDEPAQVPENEEELTEDSIEAGTESNFSMGNIILVAGLVVGNLLIIGLAVFAYKKLTGPDVAAEALSDDGEEGLAEEIENEEDSGDDTEVSESDDD